MKKLNLNTDNFVYPTDKTGELTKGGADLKAKVEKYATLLEKQWNDYKFYNGRDVLLWINVTEKLDSRSPLRLAKDLYDYKKSELTFMLGAKVLESKKVFLEHVKESIDGDSRALWSRYSLLQKLLKKSELQSLKNRLKSQNEKTAEK